MAPERVELQLKMAQTHPNTVSNCSTLTIEMTFYSIPYYCVQLIGSCFDRVPADLTCRNTAWCCGLSQQQLYTQVMSMYVQ